MKYVVVAGNTGVGKSTLVKRLSNALVQNGVETIAIDEREFHHPMLGRMFAEPPRWASLVQLNFLIQRAMRLLRLAEVSGEDTVVIMERHVGEDPLFLEYYARAGAVTNDARQGYEYILRDIEARLPTPCVLVYLRAPLEVAVERIRRGIELGERVKEHEPDSLPRYVEKMNSIYAEWAARARFDHGDRFFEPAYGESIDVTAERVLAKINGVRV